MWIFAEDFEGCKKSGFSIELKNHVRIMDSYNLEINDYILPFTTPEQAQAAYEKIKGMLKPPLIPAHFTAGCRYEAPTPKLPYPHGT